MKPPATKSNLSFSGDSTRRRIVGTLLFLAVTRPGWAAGKPAVEIWKGPACDCCKDWMTHLESNGFAFKAVHENGNTDIRNKLGVPVRYGSCHTALVGGYAIEGHVPAQDIHRLLKLRPSGVGLAVPGMPLGSPGMDGPQYGARRDRYDVLFIQRNGTTRVFKSYP